MAAVTCRTGTVNPYAAL